MAKRTQYQRGAEIEYKIVAEMKEKGALVAVRSAGSHSKVDVWIITKEGKILLIQSKRSKGAISLEKLYQEDINDLIELAKLLDVNVGVEFWHWQDRKGFVQKIQIKKVGESI